MTNGFMTTKYTVLDEIKIGTGVNMRLVETEKTKTRTIQSWESMSGRWATMYRYGDIDEIWAKWKKMKVSIEAEKAKKGKKK